METKTCKNGHKHECGDGCHYVNNDGERQHHCEECKINHICPWFYIFEIPGDERMAKHSKNCMTDVTGKYHICEGKVTCPNTKNDECGRELNRVFHTNGKSDVCTVFCFGCNNLHEVASNSLSKVYPGANQ